MNTGSATLARSMYKRCGKLFGDSKIDCYSKGLDSLASEGEVKLTAAMQMEENGKRMNKFYPLTLEISKVNALTLSWTIVHPIDDRSPLFNFNENDMKNANLEILVFVKAFDEVFSNTVMTRTSYAANEIIWGGKFRIMYYPSADKSKTILDLDMLDEYDKIDLLQPVNFTQPVSG